MKVKVVSAWPTLCLSYKSVITGFIQAYNQMNFTEMEPSASPIVFFPLQCCQALSTLAAQMKYPLILYFAAIVFFSSSRSHFKNW